MNAGGGDVGGGEELDIGLTRITRWGLQEPPGRMVMGACQARLDVICIRRF
jgi:hypothetical protein